MLAMVFLARADEKQVVSIGQIAESEHIPQRMLERIMLQLKNHGWLESTRGKAGGYRLTKQPDQISLLDIVLRFEDSVSMLACTCEDGYRPCEFCKDEYTCPIRSTFASIYRQTVDTLRRTTLADLVK